MKVSPVDRPWIWVVAVFYRDLLECPFPHHLPVFLVLCLNTAAKEIEPQDTFL